MYEPITCLPLSIAGTCEGYCHWACYLCNRGYKLLQNVWIQMKSGVDLSQSVNVSLDNILGSIRIMESHITLEKNGWVVDGKQEFNLEWPKVCQSVNVSLDNIFLTVIFYPCNHIRYAHTRTHTHTHTHSCEVSLLWLPGAQVCYVCLSEKSYRLYSPMPNSFKCGSFTYLHLLVYFIISFNIHP